MKKIFLYILAGSLCFSACKKDDEVETYKEPEDITVQNSYDDQAIQKFMDENYLDAQGNIKPFSSTDTADDNYKKLSEMAPITLPSGVKYIVRDGAQPDPANAKTVGSSDIIKLMVKATFYIAGNTDGNVKFLTSGTSFENTINGSGSPVVDPKYYYVRQSVLTSTNKDRSYYEIEGFREALQKFKSFNNLNDGDPYNLQGVIIVPSRAAFARDPHYNYINYSLRNATFVFNFQLYNTEPRPTDQD